MCRCKGGVSDAEKAVDSQHSSHVSAILCCFFLNRKKSIDGIAALPEDIERICEVEIY